MIVACAQCGKSYRFGSELAGKRVRCKVCKGVIELEAVDADAVPEPPKAAKPRPAPARKLAPPPPPREEPEDDPFDRGEYDLAGLREPDDPPPVPDEPYGGGIAVSSPEATAVRAPARRGVSIATFRKRFGRSGVMLENFARAQATAFSPRKLDGRCDCCRRDGDFQAYEITWQATFSTGNDFSVWNLVMIVFGGLMVIHKKDAVTFATYHAVCRSCLVSHRILKWVGLLLFTASILLGVAAFCLIVYGLLPANPFVSRAGPWVVGGAAVFLAAFAMIRLSGNLRAPWALRNVAPRPFYRKRMRRV